VKRRPVVILGCVVVLTLLVLIAANDRPVDGLQATLDGINVGMTDDEVTSAFAMPADEYTDFAPPGRRFGGGVAWYRRSWRGKDASVSVYFDERGTVVGKEPTASSRLKRGREQAIDRAVQAIGL